MHFVADESVDRPIVDCLRQAGHQVYSIAERHPGVHDQTVLELANERRALLLTADKDFGEAVFRLHQFTWGVLLIRLAGLSPQAKAGRVAAAVSEHGPRLEEASAVLTPRALRIRHISQGLR